MALLAAERAPGEDAVGGGVGVAGLHAVGFGREGGGEGRLGGAPGTEGADDLPLGRGEGSAVGVAAVEEIAGGGGEAGVG